MRTTTNILLSGLRRSCALGTTSDVIVSFRNSSSNHGRMTQHNRSVGTFANAQPSHIQQSFSSPQQKQRGHNNNNNSNNNNTSSSVVIQARDPVFPYPISPRKLKVVPKYIPRPPYAATGRVPIASNPDRILLFDDENSVAAMRDAGRLARKVLDVACRAANVGVTTDEIDTLVHETIIDHGAYPSPLNYQGFPKSLCSSINEVICHGIPDARPLQLGDVVSFDVSCYLNGVHGDNCATVIVGDNNDDDDDQQQQQTTTTDPSSSSSAVISGGNNSNNNNKDWRGVLYKTSFDSEQQERHFQLARRLVNATLDSLYAAIDVCKPGGCLSHVGHAIHDVADSYGFSTVEKYRGHGISHEFHCAPFVKHYRNDDALRLVPGMIFTIEPMLVEGSAECFEWSDDWTVATIDNGLSAQFEHTVLITETGVEILTLPPPEGWME